jgi:DNA-binding GntR family transcriptional regulator
LIKPIESKRFHGPTMTTLQRATLNQRVYRQLRRMILEGELAPGCQLDERALTERLGVSQTPFREATAQLVKEGLVDYFPYRGNFVRSFTVQQVRDLYQVRQTLEGLAVRLTIPKLSQEDLDQIRRLLAGMDKALQEDDLEAYGREDRAFHQFIIQKTGNEALIQVLEHLDVKIQMVRALANQCPDVVERTAGERPAILAALEARDADRAAALMEAHIAGVCRSVVKQLAENDLQVDD